MKYRIIMIAILSLITVSQVFAKTALPFLYSIKYICGLQKVPSGNPPFEPPVKPGNYATSINIHNYHSDVGAIMLRKAIITDGIIGPITQLQLRPNEAINIDCTKIARSIPSALPSFFEGFLEIASSVQISVAAVYTSQGCIGTDTSGCTKLGELALEVVPQQAFRDQ